MNKVRLFTFTLSILCAHTSVAMEEKGLGEGFEALVNLLGSFGAQNLAPALEKNGTKSLAFFAELSANDLIRLGFEGPQLKAAGLSQCQIRNKLRDDSDNPLIGSANYIEMLNFIRELDALPGKETIALAQNLARDGIASLPTLAMVDSHTLTKMGCKEGHVRKLMPKITNLRRDLEKAQKLKVTLNNTSNANWAEVRDFLSSIQMIHHAPALMDGGATSLAIFANLDMFDLIGLGFKQGEMPKLLREISRIRGELSKGRDDPEVSAHERPELLDFFRQLDIFTADEVEKHVALLIKEGITNRKLLGNATDEVLLRLGFKDAQVKAILREIAIINNGDVAPVGDPKDRDEVIKFVRHTGMFTEKDMPRFVEELFRRKYCSLALLAMIDSATVDQMCGAGTSKGFIAEIINLKKHFPLQ